MACFSLRVFVFLLSGWGGSLWILAVFQQSWGTEAKKSAIRHSPQVMARMGWTLSKVGLRFPQRLRSQHPWARACPNCSLTGGTMGWWLYWRDVWEKAVLESDTTAGWEERWSLKWGKVGSNMPGVSLSQQQRRETINTGDSRSEVQIPTSCIHFPPRAMARVIWCNTQKTEQHRCMLPTCLS